MTNPDITPDPILKRCSKGERCVHPQGPWLPATREYFRVGKGYRNGFRGQCKQCLNAASIEWQKRSPEKCRAIRKRSDAKRKNKQVADNRKRRHANPERYREKRKLYRAKEDVRATIREYKRKYYKKHRTRIIERDRQYYIKHRAEKIEYAETYTHVRKARQRLLPANFSRQQWEYALRHFEGRCAVCGRPAGLWHTLARDHWIPLSDMNCPGTVAENIVPLCHGIDGCNNSKNGKDPEQWLIEKYGKRKAKQILKRIEAYFEWVQSKDDHR